ncbi:MAG TPA: hypothetical protein VLR26_10690 [Frankiaceae bacterium]|nr:hypothetical protein [Frankiaceae bacterium]
MLFVDVPVTDVERSEAFFAALGFSFNPMFSDEASACMLVGEQPSSCCSIARSSTASASTADILLRTYRVRLPDSSIPMDTPPTDRLPVPRLGRDLLRQFAIDERAEVIGAEKGTWLSPKFVPDRIRRERAVASASCVRADGR